MNEILKNINKIAHAAGDIASTSRDADVILKLCRAATELTKAWATVEDVTIHRQFHEQQENFIPGEEPLVNNGH